MVKKNFYFRQVLGMVISFANTYFIKNLFFTCILPNIFLYQVCEVERGAGDLPAGHDAGHRLIRRVKGIRRYQSHNIQTSSLSKQPFLILNGPAIKRRTFFAASLRRTNAGSILFSDVGPLLQSQFWSARNYKILICFSDSCNWVICP